MFNRSRTFFMERLEDRQLMAGDVTAYFQNNTLFLDEAAGQANTNNSVIIRQIGETNKLRISGNTTADGTSSLVNGQPYVDITLPATTPVAIDALFGGGDDTVILTEMTPFGMALSNITIRAGAYGFTDSDSVLVTNVNTNASIGISTEAGNDWVYVDSVGANSLGVNTRDGSDRVQVVNSGFTRNVSIYTAGYSPIDDDYVQMLGVNVYGGSLQVDLGDGRNTFQFDRVNATDAYGFGEFRLTTGAGNDSGSIRNLNTWNLSTSLGNADDNLQLDYIRAHNMTLDGSGGIDNLSKTNNMWVDQAFETGWELLGGRKAIWGLTPVTMGTLAVKTTAY